MSEKGKIEIKNFIQRKFEKSEMIIMNIMNIICKSGSNRCKKLKCSVELSKKYYLKQKNLERKPIH